MMSEALMESKSDQPAGEVAFIRASESQTYVSRSERDDYVTVTIPEVPAEARGQLAWLLETALDRALERRGACAPGTGASATMDSSLSDQLYRARLIGARGFAILLPTMEPITNRSGALDADDCAALRWWVGMTKHRPIRLYLDVADCMFGAYLEPVTLTQMLHLTSCAKEAPAAVVVEWVDSAAANAPVAADSSQDRGGEHEHAFDGSVRRAPISDIVASTGGRALTDSDAGASQALELESLASVQHETADADEDLPTETTNAPFSVAPTVLPPSASSLSVDEVLTNLRQIEQRISLASELRDASVDTLANQHAEIDRTSPHPSSEDAQAITTPIALQALAERGEQMMLDTGISCSKDPTDPQPQTHDVILPIPHPETIAAPAPAADATEAPHEDAANLPLHADAPNAWRSWMQRLEAARGPKPLNAIEQLFMHAYVPLSDAYHRGIAGAECSTVLDQWASSFAKSYSEAYDAMRVRGRRPMMVLDLPEAAQRLARLHGARTVQLILVDGMRFDVGMRVERLLLDELGQKATLTDRFLLWSALPTTTAQQLELIARGAESLRDGDIHSETPVLVARGRSASTLRRIRAGARELLKLDLVEARLAEAGPPLPERLDRLAVEVSTALASSISRLPARTLVAVFADHGFCLDSTDAGSASMRHGGASPEEVLVPGFAWLVGQPH
jgi:hypothetical protein